MFDYEDEKKQMKLGELIIKLQQIENQEKYVVFDFGHHVPTEFYSWRGSYDLLSLNYVEWTFENKADIKVKKLLEQAQACVGVTMTGWKGGDYTMDTSSPIWIAHPNHSGHTGLLDVIDSKYQVILSTFYCEY